MRVTFWAAHGSSALIVEDSGRKLCHVVQHPIGNQVADVALADAAWGADLLVFPGDWEAGLALKALSDAKLLGVTPRDSEANSDQLTEAVAARAANVFIARKKMFLDL